MRNSAKPILVSCLTLFLLSGCKIALVVVEGGSIESASSRFLCFEPDICVVEITDTDFREVFIARPREGWEFSHWLSGDSLLCGGSTDPRCEVDNRGFEGNAGAEAVIESGKVFFLLPIFLEKAEEPPAPLSADLQAKYDNSCDQCHTNGNFGALRNHDEAAWQRRLAKGMDALLNSVKGGLGSMPPGGNCSTCSDDDYRTLITYMSGPES